MIVLDVLSWLFLGWIGSFWFWRIVRDDYMEVTVIRVFVYMWSGGWLLGKLAYLMLHSAEVGSAMVWFDLSKMDLEFALLGVFLGSRLVMRHERTWWGGILDAFCESMVVVGAFWLMLLFVPQNWGASGRLSIVVGVWLLSGIGVFWINRNYRRFYWYVSGKVGFTFWVCVIWLALVGLAWTLVYDDGWLKFWESVLSVLLLVWGVVSLYLLSERRAGKDFGFVTNLFKK